MPKLERIYQNVVLVVSIAILLPGAAVFGGLAIWQQQRLSSCLHEIEDQPDAGREHRQAVNTPSAAASGEQKQPADTGEEIRQPAEEGPEVASVCERLGADAGTALARASYDLSLLGYFATLLFGALGVVGIFLSYTASRDARDDARRQAAAAAAAAAGGPAVGGSGGGGSAGTGGGPPAAP